MLPKTPKKNLFKEICKHLDTQRVVYGSLHHEPTLTSEDAARARGEDIRIGGKALLLKVSEDFGLFVLSAALRIDSQAVRNHFGVKKIRFASVEELQKLTGLVPGSVPPLGEPILPFKLYVDPSISDNERIAFNAGSLTDSLILRVEDYLKISQPTIFSFSKSANQK